MQRRRGLADMVMGPPDMRELDRAVRHEKRFNPSHKPEHEADRHSEDCGKRHTGPRGRRGGPRPLRDRWGTQPP